MFDEIFHVIKSGDSRLFKTTIDKFNKEDKWAAINTQDEKGMTLLHIAADLGHFDIVQELLALGAIMDIKNVAMKTPLDLAVANNHRKIATLLEIRINWLDNLKGNMHFSLNKVLYLIQDAYAAIKQAGNGRDLVLVIGSTGVGKSTLINYLDGVTYKLVGTYGLDLKAELINGVEIACVGNDPMLSTTLYPAVVNVKTNGVSLDLADLAGLNGTREPEVEVAGTLSTHLLSRMADRIKSILFVIDTATLKAGRGGLLRETVKMLNKIIGGNFTETIAHSIHFAITKVPNGVTVQEVLELYVKKLISDIEAKQLEGQEAFNEENSAMLLTLNMMLNAPERVFIPDITDRGESRRQILETLNSSPYLDKNGLYLISVDKHQEQFNAMLTVLSNEYSYRVQLILDELPALIKHKEEERDAVRENVLVWSQEITDATIAKVEGLTAEKLAQMLKENGARVEALIQKKLIAVEKLRELTTNEELLIKYRDEIDTEEPINYGEPFKFMHLQEFIYDMPNGRREEWNPNKIQKSAPELLAAIGSTVGGPVGAFIGAAIGGVVSFFGGSKRIRLPQLKAKPGTDTYIFENKHMQAPGKIVDLDCIAEGGEFKNREMVDGTFRVEYNYPYGGQNVMGQVTIKLAKRDIPSNRALIEQYNTEISKVKQATKEIVFQLELYGKEEITLRSEQETLQTQKLDAIRKTEALNIAIAERKQLIVAANDKVAEIYKEIMAYINKWENTYLALEVNEQMFKTLGNITQILEIDKYNPVVQKFVTEANRFEAARAKPNFFMLKTQYTFIPFGADLKIYSSNVNYIGETWDNIVLASTENQDEQKKTKHSRFFVGASEIPSYSTPYVASSTANGLTLPWDPIIGYLKSTFNHVISYAIAKQNIIQEATTTNAKNAQLLEASSTYSVEAVTNLALVQVGVQLFKKFFGYGSSDDNLYVANYNKTLTVKETREKLNRVDSALKGCLAQLTNSKELPMISLVDKTEIESLLWATKSHQQTLENIKDDIDEVMAKEELNCLYENVECLLEQSAEVSDNISKNIFLNTPMQPMLFTNYNNGLELAAVDNEVPIAMVSTRELPGHDCTAVHTTSVEALRVSKF